MPPKRCTSEKTQYSNKKYFEALSPKGNACKFDKALSPAQNTDCPEPLIYTIKKTLFSIKCGSVSSIPDRDIKSLYTDILEKDPNAEAALGPFRYFKTAFISDQGVRDGMVSHIYNLLGFNGPEEESGKKMTGKDFLDDAIKENRKAVDKRLSEDQSYKSDGVENFKSAILNADPTHGRDLEYSVWILDRYMTGKINLFEDITSRVRENLEFYNKNKSHGLPALSSVNSLDDLFDEPEYTKYGPVRPLIKGGGPSDMVRGQTKIVFEDRDAIVVLPKSKEASIYWGQGTKWCTAQDNKNNMFKSYYTPTDPLYIIINKKNPSEKYQLHRSTKQYMDKMDNEVGLRELSLKFPELVKQFHNTNLLYFTPNPSIVKYTDYNTFLQFTGEIIKPVSFDLSIGGYDNIPPGVFYLTTVNYLTLYNNKLKTIPKEIGGLTELRELYLGHNRLESLPKEIGDLKNLQKLSLRYNKITSLPKEIGNLAKLETLELESNKLTSLPKAITNIKNLKVLKLQDNQLTTLPKEIGGLIQLKELELTRNELTSLPSEIGNLRNLERLAIGSNSLTHLPDSINKLEKLTALRAGENRLTTLPDYLSPLKNLESATLVDGNNLSPEYIEELVSRFSKRGIGIY